MNKKIIQHFVALVMLMFFCGASGIKATNTEIYTGTLAVDLSFVTEEDPGTTVLVSPDQILLERISAEKINLQLKNFAFGPLFLGDIVINDILVTKTGDRESFKSEVVRLELGGGMIPADVEVVGTIKDEKADVSINVEWLVNDENRIPIPVSFVGDLIADGLRLSGINVNGQPIEPTFNADIFNYKGMLIGSGDKITYTKVDPTSTVDVEMDGNYLYLYVSKDGKRNRYTLVDSGDLDEDINPLPISKIEIGQNIDGNLLLRNGSEVIGNIAVAGKISYYKPYNGSEWCPIGLPYNLSQVKVVKENGSEVVLADSYWYSYNDKAEQAELSGMNSASIMKLKISTDAVALNLISESGASIAGDNSQASAGYSVVANKSLQTQLLSDFVGYDIYYTFNGTEFIQADPTAEIAPATMFIGYKGVNAVTTISVPDPGLSGIEGVDTDALNVYSSNGQIYISNYSGIAKVYTLSGSNVLDKLVDGETNFDLANGVYVIQTGTKGTVVIVR